MKTQPFSSALLLLLGLLATSFAQDSPGPSRADRSALAAEAARLFEAAGRSQRGPGLPLPELHARLSDLGNRLEAAGLDSLASRALGEAGWAAFRMGQIDEGKKVLHRAIALARKVDAPREELPATNALAVCHMAAGELDQAIGLWTDLIPRNREIGNLSSAARNWANIVNSLNQMGRVPEALEAADSAAAAMVGYEVADGPAGMAIMRSQLLHSAGRPLDALAWADTAVARSRAIGFAGAIGVALGLRSEIKESLGRLEEARTDRAESQIVLESSGDLYYGVRNLMARATLFRRLGQADSCRIELERGMPLAHSIGDPFILSQGYAIQGAWLFDQGRAAEAEATLQTALRYANEAERRDPNPGSIRSPGSEARAVLAALMLSQDRTAEAFVAVDRGRGSHFQRRVSGGVPDSLDVAELQGILGQANAALVLWSDSKLYEQSVFVVTGDSLVATVAERERMGDEVQAALQLIAAGAPDERCRVALEAVAGKVLPTWLQRVPDGVRRLYLVPPSYLAGLPLEVLPTADGEPLGDRFAISYLPAASALPLLQRRQAPGNRMLVLADPKSPPPSGEVMLAAATHRTLSETPLPAARREARRVSIPRASVLSGEEATKQDLARHGADSVAVLHFATHALANPLRPQDSYLLLAGEDDRLTAAEVEGLALPADLVTLSGCRTGGGFTYVGEGTFGLSRSFLLAGARSVVTSMWDVEDGAAAKFMEHFYRGMREGKPRDEALRETRLRLRRDGRPLRDRAAFVLAGVGHEPVALLAASPPAATLPPAAGWAALAALAAGIVLYFLRRRRGRTPGSAQ